MKKNKFFISVLCSLFLLQGCVIVNNHRNRTLNGYYRCPTNNHVDYFIKQGTGRKLKIRKLR